MTKAIVNDGLVPDRNAVTGWTTALSNAARATGPLLLFGWRLWASVCLALYVAFWLELNNPYWAGASAALVCQPHLGASLRKGWYRVIGTLIGAVAIVLLTALSPQDRAGFLIGLALWGAACALAATLLRNFAAYAAALAGYTAAIIASDQLGATGGVNGEAFTLAIARVSEIWIGIVCAGIVLAGTDFGAGPRRLAAQFAALLADTGSRFGTTLARAGSTFSEMQPVRRELVRQVIALEPIVDEAIGEWSRLRYHSPMLGAAVNGLFAALAGWRTVAVQLAHLPEEAARQEADAVLRHIPKELRPSQSREPTLWTADPIGMRRMCGRAIRMLIAMPAGTPSLRLLADQTASVLAGWCQVLDGLTLLIGGPARPRTRRRRMRVLVPDWSPALVNACRTFVIIGAVEVFWIITQWPNGTTAITFTAISVILFVPRADAAAAGAMSFVVGVAIAAICAAIIEFAVLPRVETFAGFAVALGLFLIPAGCFMAQSWKAVMFAAMVGNFVPLLAPTNPMSYETAHYYNAALAVVAGCGAAALSFRLLPPLSPALRTRRLLALNLHDLRRLATGHLWSPDDWRARMYSRLAVLPDEAEPLERAQLVTALSFGTEIIHLRRIAPQLGVGAELASALEAFAQAKNADAIAGLTRLDRRLASLADADPQASFLTRARSRMLLVCDALVQHRAYFDEGAPA